MKETLWSRIQGTKQRGQRILGDCWQWEANGQCSKGDNCSFRHDIKKRGKMTQSKTSPNSFMQQNEKNASKTRSPRGRSPSGGQGDGVPKACHKQAAAGPRGSRTCVCSSTFLFPGWHTQGVKDELTSCRGTVQWAWQKPPVSREGGRAGLLQKGKRPPRGTGTTVLTYPGSAPRVSGKAGENGQNSGEMGGSSPWTRPSAPGCGDTLKALAGDQHPIWVGDCPRRRLRGRYRLVRPT